MKRRLFFHLSTGILGKNLSFLIISRNEAEIEDALSKIASFMVPIQRAAVDVYVQMFTSDRIARDPPHSK
jgi:hypothetical protein